MGNCCGKADSGNFHGEGRTLGAQPANAPAQPSGGSAAAPPKIGGTGRAVGGASSDSSDPKAAAARAAEV
ncbi:hypothetical protein Tdes44962_MAKER07236 [Teratosphaeria destructans]|uniref:Uncharacterized protein n=1 Tax=Teratosphaeria destructans TaxID=418781 RepID=A0A9W7SZM3_9PEZI|nr:hypothetical protein Tdes44962_MAKER07236 [Teratosphaeria destructans]